MPMKPALLFAVVSEGRSVLVWEKVKAPTR